MKREELKRVGSGKRGDVSLNGVKIEAQEESTARFLALYGFNIDFIKPVNTPKMRNPDFLMFGTIWELKAPLSYNGNKLKNRMKKASRQAGHVIFDLRYVKKDYDKAEYYIIKLFEGNSKIRRMIVITKDERVLDFRK